MVKSEESAKPARVHTGLFHTGTLALLYVALMPIAWPRLPGNLHLVDLLFPVLAIASFRAFSTRWRWRPLDFAVLAYLASALPSLLVTSDLTATGIELAKRLYLGCVYLVFAVYVRDHGVGGLSRVLIRSTAVIVGSSLVILLTLRLAGTAWIWAGDGDVLPYLGDFPRLRGFMEGPEMLGNYLTLVIPFALLALVAGLERGQRWFAQLAVLFAGMVFTFAHAVTGFAVSAFLAVRLLLGRSLPRSLQLLGAASVIVIVVALNTMLVATVRDLRMESDRVAAPPPAGVHVFQPPEGANRLRVDVVYNPMHYLLLKQIGWSAFLDAPLTGVGVGNFQTLTEDAYQRGEIDSFYRAIDPHSTLFGELAETGLPGAIAAYAVLALALLRLARFRSSPPETPGDWMVLAAGIGVIGLCVNSMNVDLMSFRFLWVALALLRG